ncbi:hypothetical protein DM01DRAFT_1192421 [Hesseltinella vesiculosa]|uniref:Xylanolytic transcriptional activator regulatory domain-containing protein n=1 Tax=Hesseltinella vesiculosa TaxID=101127 RepID=A0A1X2GRS5_9FUNG|nr:hypothetical protein DM01DRAFT_1192421 [Hesseltinella vesiculosa]
MQGANRNMDYYIINDMGQPYYTVYPQRTLHRQPSELSLNDMQTSEPTTPIPAVPAYHSPVQQPNLMAEIDTSLFALYFKHVHPYMPILDQALFHQQVHSSQPPMILVYAVCAVASAWSPSHRQAIQQAPPGFDYYRRSFALVDVSNAIPSLTNIQAYLLLIKYQEQYPRTGFFYRSSYYLGNANEMANALQLASASLNLDPQEYEARKRAFWSLFLVDLWMSIEEGRLLKINVDSNTVDYPSLTMESHSCDDHLARYNMMIRLGRTLAEIYQFSRELHSRQEIQGTVRTANQQIHEEGCLLRLQSSLDKYLHELTLIPSFDYPPSSKLEKYPAEAAPVQDIFTAFLHMMYHYAILLLHRHYVLYPMHQQLPPTFDQPMATPSSSSSPPSSVSSSSTSSPTAAPPYPHRQLCAVSASIINNLVQSVLESNPIEVFHYPLRGAQWAIMCLTMARSVHKFEMETTPPMDPKHAAASQLHHDSLRFIQQLSPESAAFEIHQLAKDTELAELCGKLGMDGALSPSTSMHGHSTSAPLATPPPSAPGHDNASSASSSPVLSASTTGSVTAAMNNTRLSSKPHARRPSTSSASFPHSDPLPVTSQKRPQQPASSTVRMLNNPALYNSSGTLTNPSVWASLHGHIPHLSMPPHNHHQQPIQPPASLASNANPAQPIRRTAPFHRSLQHHYSQDDLRARHQRGVSRTATSATGMEGSRLKKHKSIHFNMTSQQVQNAIHKYPPPTTSASQPPSPSLVASSSQPSFNAPNYSFSPQPPRPPPAQAQYAQPLSPMNQLTNPVHRRHTISYTDNYSHLDYATYPPMHPYPQPSPASLQQPMMVDMPPAITSHASHHPPQPAVSPHHTMPLNSDVPPSMIMDPTLIHSFDPSLSWTMPMDMDPSDQPPLP